MSTVSFIDYRGKKSPISDHILKEFNMVSSDGVLLSYNELDEQQKKIARGYSRYAEHEMQHGQGALIKMASDDIDTHFGQDDEFSKLWVELSTIIINAAGPGFN